MSKRAKVEKKEETPEKRLWKAADKLRKNIDAAESLGGLIDLIYSDWSGDRGSTLWSCAKVEILQI